MCLWSNCTQTVPCYLALFVLAEWVYPLAFSDIRCWCLSRLFGLLMAFDALRLRNVIQLVGILCVFPFCLTEKYHAQLTCWVSVPCGTGCFLGDTNSWDQDSFSATTELWWLRWLCRVFYRLLFLLPYELTCAFPKSCGGEGTLYKKVEHFLIAVPAIIAASLLIMTFFVRALYYEFG